MLDNNLHKIVREKFSEFEPDFQPNDWLEMRKKMRFQKFRPFALVGGLLLVFGGIYFVLNLQNVNNQQVKSNFVSKTYEKKIIEFSQKKEIIPKKRLFKIATTPKINLVKLPEKVIEQEKIIENVVEIKKGKFEKNIFENLEKVQKSSFSKIENKVKFPELNFESKLGNLERIKQIKALGETFELTPKTVLERNINRWKNVVIVCDFTSSMYPYGTQVFDWLAKNMQNEKLKGIVFFTDCDSLGRQTDGKTSAKMFFSSIPFFSSSFLATSASVISPGEPPPVKTIYLIVPSFRSS